MEASTADPAVTADSAVTEEPAGSVEPDPAPVEPETTPEPDTPQAEPGSIELVTGKTINLKDMAPVVAALAGEGLPVPDGVLHLQYPNGSLYNVRVSAIVSYD